MSGAIIDRPVTDRPLNLAEMLRIAMHPAMRLGLLDAQADRPPDPDRIMDRILRETPEGALKRLTWIWPQLPLDLLDLRFAERVAREVALAQWRYEEGRLLHLEHRVKVKAWGHPDYLPAGVRQFARERAKKMGMLA